MKRIALFISMAAAAGCTGAKAADLAAAPYTKAPVAEPIDSWAGIYLGGQIGYEFTSARYDLANAGAAEPFTPNMNSVAGGGHIGAQGQWGRWVLGVEGNYNWTDMKETDASAVTTNRLSSMAIDGLGSVVGKVGGAFDGGWLTYGKGGWAVANIKTSITTPVASVAQWQSGWTIGGGLEKQIAHNWVVEPRSTTTASRSIAPAWLRMARWSPGRTHPCRSTPSWLA